MKRIRRALWASLLLVCTGASARDAATHDPSMGAHGMALFGDRDGLYVSHLPMFHAPHDYQVVLKVRLADPEQDRALRARIGAATALWSIDPECFALARLAPGHAAPLHRFSAEVFEGHFERGGKRIAERAGFVIERRVYFGRLDPSPGSRSEARYLPVGRFLFKQVDSRPDMDHIVKLAKPATAPLAVPRQGVNNPEAALAQLAPVIGTVYFETGDLR